MNPQNYQCTITAAIPAGEAFEKINRVKDWWAINFNGNTHNLRDRFTVHFARTTWGKMEITEMVPNQRIVWKVVDCYLSIFQNPYLWKGNQIIWDISPDEDGTRVTMTHVGLTPEVECYEDCRKGWNFYVGESLFKLLTEDKGLPGSGIFANVYIAGRKYEGLLFSQAEPFPDFAQGYIIVDVRENRGERVLSAYFVDILDIKNMAPNELKGRHYMLVENQQVSGGIQPLEDLRQLITGLG